MAILRSCGRSFLRIGLSIGLLILKGVATVLFSFHGKSFQLGRRLVGRGGAFGFFLSAFVSLSSCGLSVIVNIDPPPVVSVDNKSAQILLSSAYMKEISNFQGISFFYKLYPCDANYYNKTWTIYSSFEEAYRGDYKRLSSSYSAEEALASYGYLPFNREERYESSLPILKISSSDLNKDLLLTLDFSDLFSKLPDTRVTALATLKALGTGTDSTVKFPLLRRAVAVTIDNCYKTFGYLTRYNLLSQKDDADLRKLPREFLQAGANFNVVIYGVVYAGDIFKPVRSQPFRVVYIEGLTPGKEALR